MIMAPHFPLPAIFLLFNVVSTLVSADLVFEDGYTVSTVLDGHKLRINPHSVLSRPGSSDLIILDSSGSAFYTVSFSTSQGDTVIDRIAGNGTAGFSDGDSGSAMFKKPRSFAVDLKGNIYVADKSNCAIRKISKSGVTTIAGGHSQRGHVDGPGQNASFSDDFELAFFPERCALMISDHGNQLVRQINLKLEDCARGSQSVLRSTVYWILALGVSCLVGLIIGFAVRPYIIAPVSLSPTCVMICGKTGLLAHCLTKLCRQEGFGFSLRETWKHSQISLGRQILMFCFDIRSAVVSSTLITLVRRLIMLSFSYLSLVFSISTIESQTLREKPISLLDTDVLSSSEITNSQKLDDQLKDLIGLDGGLELSESTDRSIEQGNNLLSDSHQSLDDMIQANIMGFAEQAKRVSPELSLMCSSGLVKRR